MFKQASLKAFTSDFDVCDKDLGIDSVSSATCIESSDSVHQPNLSATVSTSACETNPESESSSSSGSQSEDEMPVPDARLFSSGKYERRFTWLYFNVAKGGYCCKLCKCFNKRCYCVKLIVFPFLPLPALISPFERPRHHSPKTEKKTLTLALLEVISPPINFHILLYLYFK